MSDVDLLVERAKRDTAHTILERCGFTRAGGALGHHATVWTKGKFVVDLHHDLIGLGRAHIDHAALWDRMHPDDIVALQAEVGRHLQGETPLFMIEGRKRNADGSWRWVMMRGQVVARGPQGQPLRVVGTETDVTPMRVAEAALQRAHEVLELAVEVGQVGIWEADLAKDARRIGDTRVERPAAQEQPSAAKQKNQHSREERRTPAARGHYFLTGNG